MKSWQGISDSVAGVIETPAQCRQCGATTRLGNGLCLSCTLREGLDGDRESSRESFEAILAEDEVHDTHWRVGNYEILEEIGRGGMGVIYRARQRHSRRIVALKRIMSYDAVSRETLERFRREAEAACGVAPCDEVDPARAEDADAVIEDHVIIRPLAHLLSKVSSASSISTIAGPVLTSAPSGSIHRSGVRIAAPAI